MIILSYISKGFVKIDKNREFSVATITKVVRFRHDGKEICLPKQEYKELVKTGANVSSPYEYGDLVVTTNTNKYVFEDIMLSADNNISLVDEILSLLNSRAGSESITIALDSPDDNSYIEYEMDGNLTTERLI